MILLTPCPAMRQEVRPVATIFGAGTIGSAVADSLRNSAQMEATVLDLDWSLPDRFAKCLAAIELRLVELLQSERDGRRLTSLHVIWSAGRAGFFSTDDDVDRELDHFRSVLRCAERLAESIPDVPVTVVLTSSAGGLFEGQHGVRPETPPFATRPYGRLKLQQEEMLLASRAPLTRKIYRLTSVYGYIRPDQRRGLIPTLIANGLRQRSSQITGLASTVRDYVWIEDIAEYLSQGVLRNSGGDCTTILASTKPSSILEIQRMVEAAIGRPLYVCYLPQATNSSPITFDTSAVPDDWRPSELATNVRKIAVDAMARQTAFLEAL